MKIIALANGHDASITALEDGKVLYIWELERVLNKKHFCGVDEGNEIADILYNHALPRLGWKVEDIDIIGFAGHSEWRKTEFNGLVPTYKPLEYATPYAEGRIKLRGSNREIRCFSVIHHVNHAASAYYTSPFTSSIIYTHDGLGDLVSGIWGTAHQNKLRIHGELTLKCREKFGLEPNAIGLTYSYLGRIFPFLRRKNGAEDLLGTAGKFMGLSSYGKPREEWRDECRKLLNTWMPDPSSLPNKLGLTQSILADFNAQETKDLAATIQDVAECFIIESLRKIKLHATALGDMSSTGLYNLCMAGGCALNVQINSRILDAHDGSMIVNDKVTHFKLFKNLYVPAATSDCGLSLGCALYIWHHILDNSFEGIKFFNPYLGDTLYNHPETIKDFNEWMNKNYPTIQFKKHKNMAEASINAAINLFNNKIIAWIQGRAEAGPRALGNRSLISNPCNANSKDVLNAKVKHRETWRPFAPICLKESAEKWFHIDHEQPYMLEAPLARKESADLIPAVVHVDNTARVQTVSKDNNGLLYQLLKDFKSLKGVEILLNTSANDAGLPILNNLTDALNLLKNTELDLVYVGEYVFSKRPKE